MKRLYQLLLLAAMTFAIAGTALAQVSSDGPAQPASHLYMDYNTGAMHSPPPNGLNYVGDVYSNTTAPATAGSSSTDLAGIWGDECLTIGTGTLDQLDFTIYNSSTSAGSLNTVAYTISLYDGISLASIGGFNTTVVTFGTPLAKGFYTILTVTGLSSLNIPIGTDVIVLQKILSHTGAANRMGVVHMDPPTIGSSPATFYVSNTSSAAGWYTLSGLNANPGYRLSTVNSTPTQSSTWGKLKALYR